MIIDSFTVGVVFAKLTRPTLTASTIQFSKNGIVSMRDGVLCLMFRIGNLKKSRLVGKILIKFNISFVSYDLSLLITNHKDTSIIFIKQKRIFFRCECQSFRDPQNENERR